LQKLPPPRILTSSTQNLLKYSSPRKRNQKTTNPRKSKSLAVYNSQSANESSSCCDSETHGSERDAAGRDLLGFDKAGWEPLWEAAIPYEPHRYDHATVSGLPLLRRGGGVPILLEVPFDCDPYFRPFHDISSDGANKTSSTTVDRKAHGSGDDDTVRDLPAFRCSGGDPISCDFSDHVDLSFHMYHNTSCNPAFTKRTSRL